MDFSHIPLGEDVEATFDGILISEFARQTRDEGQFQFTISADTSLAQIWMLMPQDRSYDQFRITGYPVDEPQKLQTIQPTSKIELPVGAIATFQIINPRSDYRYECRWKWIDR